MFLTVENQEQHLKISSKNAVIKSNFNSCMLEKAHSAINKINEQKQ